MSEMTDFLQALEAKFKAQEDNINALVETAVKAAVAQASPVGAVIADPIIDAVDSLVMGLLGTAAPANAVQAPTDVPSRISALENHVAALTVATVGGAQHLATIKAGIKPVAVPAEAEEPAPTASELVPTPKAA